MPAEIENTDRIVMHKKSAWHGLGIVLDEALTPRQAVEQIFGWTAIQRPMFYRVEGKQYVVDGHVLNIRSDNGHQLGVVSDGYKVIQPADMADFAEALADNGQVRCETVGSLRGGKRVWFLLKGEPFQVAKGDEIMPYVLLSNGYDGGSSFRVTPTTIRVVCSNTYHSVVPHFDTGELGESVICVRHFGDNVMTKVEEAKRALSNYGKSIEGTKKVMDTLASKDVKSEDVQKFFLECYTTEFGEIPENPKDGFEERKRLRAQSAFNSFSKRFDDEREIAGTTWWNCANSFSGLCQNDMKARGKDDVDRVERRVDSNLFGLNQARTQRAFQKAFRHALQPA